MPLGGKGTSAWSMEQPPGRPPGSFAAGGAIWEDSPDSTAVEENPHYKPSVPMRLKQQGVELECRAKSLKQQGVSLSLSVVLSVRLKQQWLSLSVLSSRG